MENIAKGKLEEIMDSISVFQRHELVTKYEYITDLLFVIEDESCDIRRELIERNIDKEIAERLFEDYDSSNSKIDIRDLEFEISELENKLDKLDKQYEVAEDVADEILCEILSEYQKVEERKNRNKEYQDIVEKLFF